MSALTIPLIPRRLTNMSFHAFWVRCIYSVIVGTCFGKKASTTIESLPFIVSLGGEAERGRSLSDSSGFIAPVGWLY